MIKTRGRKVIRDILARKGRTALVSMAIFIGVLGTIALFSLSDIIVSQLRSDLKEDELVMLDIFLNPPSEAQLDDAQYIDALAQFEGVTDMVAALSTFGQFTTDESDTFEDAILNAYHLPYDQLPIEPMRLLEGGAYPQDGMNQLMLEQRMAEAYDLSVGDTVYLRILSPSRDAAAEGVVGTVEAWTISGLVFHPYAQSPDQNIYMTPVDARYAGGVDGFNDYRFRFETFDMVEEHQDEITTYIAQNTPYSVVFVQPSDPENNQLIQAVQTLAGTMQFLALLSLLVSGFLVVNVISSLVNEQKRQIGIMKTIGASQADNFAIYSGIAFGYGIIGVIPGVLLGIPLGNLASHALAPELNTYLDGFKYSVPSVIMGIIVGLLVPVVSAFFPVFFGTRVKILSAITDLGISNSYGNSWLAKLIGKLPVPITIRQGISNVSMKKIRLGLNVFTLALAVGVFMGIFSLFSALSSGINSFLDTFNVEVGVFPNQGYSIEEMFAVLDEVNSDGDIIIDNVSLGSQFQVEFEGYEAVMQGGGPPAIFAYGYEWDDEEPAFRFDLAEGETINGDNAATGIILSNSLASKMDKGVGDEVLLKLPTGVFPLTVVGIAEFPVDQVWMDWRPLSTMAGFTEGAPSPENYRTALTVEGIDTPVMTLGATAEMGEFLTVSEGEFLPADNADTVVITRALADQAGVAVGEMLNVTATTPNGASGAFLVVGIIDLPPGLPEGTPDTIMAIAWERLAELEGLSSTGRPRPQAYFVTTTLDDPTQQEIDKVIAELDEAFLQNGLSVISFNFIELKNQISQSFFFIQAILQAVALLIALVGALGLLTTLSMSVFERQKEIGVMRSIGASSWTVAIQFLTEGLVVGFIAWLVGIPLGYLIQLGLLEVTGFGDLFGSSMSPIAIVIGLIGMMLIATLASLWPAFAAARKTVSDILRYQ